MAGGITVNLIAYNSITKDELIIGSYDRLYETWEPNISGDIALVFWEEPSSDIKTWLQANATQAQ